MIVVSENRCQPVVNKIKQQLPKFASFSKFENEFKKLTGVHCFFDTDRELMLRFDSEEEYTMFLLRWA